MIETGGSWYGQSGALGRVFGTAMRNKYDGIYLSLLVVLGLEPGCARTAEPQGSVGETASGGSASETASESESGEGTPDIPDEPPEPFSCENPYVVLQAGTDIPSGFVNCNNGFIHRAEAVECVMPQPDHSFHCLVDGGGDGDGDGDGDVTTCEGDCEAVPYGTCQPVNLQDGPACHCESGCASDADCEAGHACVCAGVFSSATQCVPADCLTDDECGDGLCGLSILIDECSGQHPSLHCAGPLDECHTDAECGAGPCPDDPEGGDVQYYCTWKAGEGFVCEGRADQCIPGCGRPFFVDDRARIARASARGDWSYAARPASVDTGTAAQLAAYWTEIGLFEHASIASFARVCLQLMQLGAPPSLLLATRAALGDEIEHARLTFGLASAFAGREIGPGPIDVAGSLDGRQELHAIVEDLVREACVEETLAAIEADEAASQAEDPCVAAILEQIASDEMRHAQLGWRTLQWILQAYPAIRNFALDRLTTAIANARQAALAPTHVGSYATLRRHGVLDDALRQRVRQVALAAVIEPASAALTRMPVAHDNPTMLP